VSQIFWTMSGGMVDPGEIFLVSSLITTQNFVAVCHIYNEWVYILGTLAPPRGAGNTG